MKDTIEIGLLLVLVGLAIKQIDLLPPKSRKNPLIILDSCALIDGRILDIAKAGFIGNNLVIPHFILEELQMLADGKNAHKRERAKFGLDIAQLLQAEPKVHVRIDHTTFSRIAKVDDKLVAAAKKLCGKLYTNDVNLAKVAAVENVQTLNVNELAQQLRPMALPGETVRTKIIQKGSAPGQGVGYLEDGTMVVVDGVSRMQGKVVEVTVVRMHQTAAGKMIFATQRNDQRR